MPIYEYRCAACGHTLEALQKLADEPLKECPECAKASLERLVSAPSFRLKGGGWYETDFKQNGEKKRNLVDAGGDSGSGKDGAKDGAKDGGAKESAGKSDGADKSSTATKDPATNNKKTAQTSTQPASG